MSPNLDKDVIDLLETAVKDKIENFDIKLHDDKKTGDGMLGEMTYISLKNKKSEQDHHFVIKQVLPSAKEETKQFMRTSYVNEITFYDQIWTAYQDFQKSFPNAENVDNVPKFYSGNLDHGKEKVLLENLKIQKYGMVPKTEPLDLKLYEEIFRVYGTFHGLSFAFKDNNAEQFWELAAPLKNNWKSFVDAGLLELGIKMITKKIQKIFEDEGDEKISNELQKYVDKGVEIFTNCIQYKGPNSVIVHGDCHSNNMLFKFSESKKVEGIKLIDFQMCYVGTPVYDLSYSFYSGADKACLDKLEHLLKIYHSSLSDTLKQYKCDIEKIYPFQTLKKEWKEYIPFGFIMGAMLWMTKYNEDIENMKINEHLDRDNSNESMSEHMNLNEEKFKIRILDLVKHLDENDFL